MGDLDVRGDLERVVDMVESVRARLSRPRVLALTLSRLLRLPAGADSANAAVGAGGTRMRGRRHSRSRDATAVRSHYDIGNEFFRLFLDRRMVYSCAYFPMGDEDLDEAQERKLDHICRKLRLAPGDRFLDVGCGWGALVLHAADRYGVAAVGITLSEAQAALARQRIAAAGLSDRCEVRVMDYRELPADGGFDKIASIGMVEHVGAATLPEYFRAVAGALRPGGLFLNHGIVSLRRARSRYGRRRRPATARTSFIQRYVFPDSELLPPADNIAPGEAIGLELRDLESLREHYARTLRLWVRRLEERRADALAAVGEETYRVWRLYMAASARLFARGDLGVMQALWGKPLPGGSLPLPPTRADLYA
jgi:cyclopropane-fatty-acyl-phospholipid synthase